MHGVRQAIRDLVEPVAAQADAPKPRLAIGEEVHPLRQGVRKHARVGHARAHAQAGPQLRRLRQDVLQALAAPRPPEKSHGREALRVRALRQSVRRPLESPRPHADPFRGQELRVLEMPQDIRPQVLSEQAPRVRLSTRRRDTAAAATTAAAAATATAATSYER